MDGREEFRHAVTVTGNATRTEKSSLSRGQCLWALLAIVVLIALPIRIYLAARAAMISRDGAVFIWYAQDLADHPITEMQEQAQHPLYPAMVLAGHGAVRGLRAMGVATDALADSVRSWSLAAVAVTLIGGLAVVIATYVLASSVFDRRIGLIAAGLAATAAEFCQLSADALTDMPHLAIYLFAMAAAIRGIRDRRMYWLLVAGALSGAAFLIRPEGAEVAVAAVVVLALPAKGQTWRQRLIGVAVLGLGAGLVASPYMLATGKLVKKKSVPRLLGGDDSAEKAPVPFATPFHHSDASAPLRSRLGSGYTFASSYGSTQGIVDLARAVALIAEKWLRALRVTFMLPAIVWLILRRKPPGEPTGQRLIAAAGLLHLLILVALIIRFDYWKLFSLRHVMVLAGLTLPFAAAGAAAILDAVKLQRRMVVAIVLAVAMIGPTLPWLLEKRHLEDAHLRRTGEWIRAHDERKSRILTTRHRVAFYAGGIHVRSPLEVNAGWILDVARNEKPGWLVFDQRRMLRESEGFFDDLEAAAGGTLELVHVAPPPDREGERRVIVYRYRPSP